MNIRKNGKQTTLYWFRRNFRCGGGGRCGSGGGRCGGGGGRCGSGKYGGCDSGSVNLKGGGIVVAGGKFKINRKPSSKPLTTIYETGRVIDRRNDAKEMSHLLANLMIDMQTTSSRVSRKDRGANCAIDMGKDNELLMATIGKLNIQ